MLVQARCRWWDNTAHDKVLKVITSRMEEKICLWGRRRWIQAARTPCWSSSRRGRRKCLELTSS